ncbi:PREDICTED: uncharacterized protein LOC105983418 [Dipodomys ordii]|uniref:Uncharacterized protein LOC105983418 n=1 Tax=Dipodomys ordii TaxID=10020 RepID=A0A1S3EWD5_DIPOR|nr:PREDICTED: uncharacterized protein LOC105983418 [Dipodomys ordii]
MLYLAMPMANSYILRRPLGLEKMYPDSDLECEGFLDKPLREQFVAARRLRWSSGSKKARRRRGKPQGSRSWQHLKMRSRTRRSGHIYRTLYIPRKEAPPLEAGCYLDHYPRLSLFINAAIAFSIISYIFACINLQLV